MTVESGIHTLRATTSLTSESLELNGEREMGLGFGWFGLNSRHFERRVQLGVGWEGVNCTMVFGSRVRRIVQDEEGFLAGRGFGVICAVVGVVEVIVECQHYMCTILRNNKTRHYSTHTSTMYHRSTLWHPK
eukprot:773283-Amorphochlora_amoeboformis.AAC.1